MEYNEYKQDLKKSESQGFNDGVNLISRMLKMPLNQRFDWLVNEIDSDAYLVAVKFKGFINIPEVNEKGDKDMLNSYFESQGNEIPF